MEDLIDITFKKGRFIFFVYDADDVLLYIGWTDDLNKKSFNFNFDYAKIKGYYYSFPDIDARVDDLIMELNPRHNKCLRSYVKLQTGKEYVNNELEKRGLKHITLPRFKKLIASLGIEVKIINHDSYICKFDCATISETLIG